MDPSYFFFLQCLSIPQLLVILSLALHLHPSLIRTTPTSTYILFLYIVNDLPLSSEPLYFVSSFQRTQHLLEPGKPFITYTNFEVKSCTMIWKRNPQRARFNLYDPGAEGSHQKIYWSVREDGVYHSWNQVDWDKRTGWGSC